MTAPRNGSFALVGGHIIDPSQGLDRPGGILVRDGLIEAIGPEIARSLLPMDVRIVDVAGLALVPGLVDLRVFVGEPGAEHRETLRSASESAAAGGVTTLVSMPDTNPCTDEPAIVDFVLRRARDTAIVRILPAAAMTRGLAGREMTEIGLLMEAGAVALSDGAHSVADAGVMRRLLTYAHGMGALVMHHVHDRGLAGDGVMNEGERASRLGLAGIPREAEAIILERDLRLVRLTGARYHAATISCAMSIELVARAKGDGLPVTAAVSINHLTLNENDVGEYRTFCKVSPPLRHEDDRQACVAALADGTIDVIVSDHNPQDVDNKRQPFGEADNGAIGIETMLSCALRLVHSGDVTLSRVIDALSTRPARILGLESGTLKPGAPADIACVDLDMPWVVDPELLASRSKNTPMDGARLSGRVIRTFVAGVEVYAYDGG